ncbi:MAG: SUMF1/EgtB/PvdO family nonheme iron enzyme [Magnetococcales bacterium]|nr:SUMF1/EgtB/PvdO family nonheme iron enzyme [Magnetococcales bacterium]
MIPRSVIQFMAVVVLLTSWLAMPGTAAGSQDRVALVIGNGKYQHISQLDNPINDARDMAAKLETLGFTVLKGLDLDQEAMEGLIGDFTDRLRGKKSTGLFFYAGHGVQIEGENYLIPVDANIRAAGQVRYKAVPAGFVLASMEEDRTKNSAINVIILDACRDNPFRSFRSTGSGLAPLHAKGGSFIAFATGPGDKAADGSGRNGTFTKHFLSNVDTPGQDINGLFDKVRRGVFRESNGEQRPWTSNSLLQSFVFATDGNSRESAQDSPPAIEQKYAMSKVPDPAPAPPSPRSEVTSLMPVCRTLLESNRLTRPKSLSTRNPRNALDCFNEVARRDPGNRDAVLGLVKIEKRYAQLAKKALSRQQTSKAKSYIQRIRQINPESSALDALEEQLEKSAQSSRVAASASRREHPTSASHTPKQNRRPSNPRGNKWREPVTGMEFVKVKAGCLDMGKEACVSAFWLGKYEIKQSEWTHVMGSNPSQFKQADRPVENISWKEVQQFISKLNARGNGLFRLPTETEWEYAAKAGTRTERYWGTDVNDACQYANVHDETSRRKNAWADWTHHKCNDGYANTAPVGKFKPNAFGLYDMLGNVFEWTCSLYAKYGTSECITRESGVNDNAYIVYRGGSWYNYPSYVNAAYRGKLDAGLSSYYLGARLLRQVR